MALLTRSVAIFAQTPVLGTAVHFALFSSGSGISNAGSSKITGNVATTSGTVTGFVNIDGNVSIDNGISSQCLADIIHLSAQLDSMPWEFYLPSPIGGNSVLNAGVYTTPASVVLSGNLILDAQGNPNAIFVFKAPGAFSVNNASAIRLINGATANNVFWQIGGSLSLGLGATLAGTVLVHDANINMSGRDTVNGRLLVLNGSLTTSTARVYLPTPLGYSSGPMSPPLANAGCMALFTCAGNIYNTGNTLITGSVGSDSGTTLGFDPAHVSGTIYEAVDATTMHCAADILNIAHYLDSLPPDIELLQPSLVGKGLVLTPHTYVLDSSALITDTLYLDGAGDSNATFVLQVHGSLSSTTGASVLLFNGAQPKNVFWEVRDSAIIAVNTQFPGTICVKTGAVILSNAANLQGRVLIISGDIMCSNDTVTADMQLSAGSVAGAASVFVGSSSTITASVAGGIWTLSNANASLAGSRLSGIFPGFDTVRYVVTNPCGSDTTIKIIEILSAPVICVGASLLLSDAISGGVWRCSNAHAEVTSGLVTGLIPGSDTIEYQISNLCGTSSAFVVVTILKQPFAGAIVGSATVQIGGTITLSDTALGGVWQVANAKAAIVNGVIVGLSYGLDTVFYIVSSACGADSAVRYIQVGNGPNTGSIAGASSVCVGSGITLTDSVAGGVWFSSNTNATVFHGVVEGMVEGIDSIEYVVLYGGVSDTAFKLIIVYGLPAAPVIDVSPPPTICSGTLFQNFGIQLPPPPNTQYSWSAQNAVIWATGNIGQYALVNFPFPGDAFVTATAGTNHSCFSSSTYSVYVTASVAPIPQVFYFQYNFVCLPGNLKSYQWGYDDVLTLDSNILPGEINQDYLNVNPDYAHKYYWVNTSDGACTQKTYYNAPVGIQNINPSGNFSITVYPNPAKEVITVVSSVASTVELTIEIRNISGQIIYVSPMSNTDLEINISNYPSGYYLVNCFKDKVRVATTRFVKE